jgi:hypothetical protein
MKIDLTADEQKVLAYACGYALRVLAEIDETQRGLTGLLRRGSAALLRKQLSDVLKKLTATGVSVRNLSLEKDTSFSIAVSIEAAGEAFKDEFLDWRVLRKEDAHVSVTPFGPLATVWQACFGDMLDDPEAVVLRPWEILWQTVRVKVLRGLATADPAAIPQVLKGAYRGRLLMQPGRSAKLSWRVDAIAATREGEIAAGFLSERCVTCAASRDDQFFCKHCAEVFISLHAFSQQSPTFRATLASVGEERMRAILRSSISWALLNDLQHRTGDCSCKSCVCGRPFTSQSAVCETCGFVHLRFRDLEADPFAYTILLQTGRRRKIAYNLATGAPAFKSYGAIDLTDEQQTDAALAAWGEEIHANLDLVDQQIREMAEIYELAGIQEALAKDKP